MDNPTTLSGLATVSRRTFIHRVVAPVTVACAAPALLLPSKTFAADTRPDQVDPDFWTAPRDIQVFNKSTGKKARLRFWDGQYLQDAYVEMCYLLLDQHENIAVQMHMGLLDVIYATQRWYTTVTGKSAATEVTSGYRTYRTNALVGGAPGSYHVKGAALDGALSGVSLSVYAAMLLRFGAGGVGLYPRHVHWDVGRKPIFWSSMKTEG